MTDFICEFNQSRIQFKIDWDAKNVDLNEKSGHHNYLSANSISAHEEIGWNLQWTMVHKTLDFELIHVLLEK